MLQRLRQQHKPAGNSEEEKDDWVGAREGNGDTTEGSNERDVVSRRQSAIDMLEDMFPELEGATNADDGLAGDSNGADSDSGKGTDESEDEEDYGEDFDDESGEEK